MTCTPRLLGSDARQQASILEFLPGEQVQPANASRADLECLAAFLVSLYRLARVPAASSLPVASEAVFTLAELLETITLRLDRLRQVEEKTPAQRALAHFLREEFEPALQTISAWAAEQLDLHGCGSDPLPLPARTLSPSDFGFHNALRSPDGRMVFVDFEYFGWDDPAKSLSDFLLHPGMALTVEQRGWFLQAMLAGMGRDHALVPRLRVACVLYGLKWVMILLNEFVPEHLARRLFADPSLRSEELQRLQLSKAREMLARSHQARIAFPYEDWIGA